MNVLSLLDTLEDLIENGSSIPFSGKVLLDKEEITELIKDIRIQLPDEVKQAQWIKEERNKILVEAQKESDRIINNAKDRIEAMANKDEIVKKAKEKAQEIIYKAEEKAKTIRIGSIQYADDILKQLETNTLQIMETLKKNREEIKKMNG
ncbi:ATP synthase subunit B family protein [Paramaledivibacter caminithermalis]|jgi:vacuolar-type H+-ATPase subunit H|uniref:Glutamic acid/alanine-rich protein n=1 Tax=Paramaledivibacter caminithermalis (strain DSM 15212 / CIP 107654 / DViRD3) TaxID=1121301 RepID=A0A1M6NIJ8_PARC5|nr:ATPase [Paramaledivibacter caminithermalis]SHJ95493.1 Glutamic acid/alanine-rich protein [Paramaledivibacter caminithermalis DSM 15212]